MARLVVLIVLSFFGGWLWKYMDERMSFRDYGAEIVHDPVGLVMGCAISAMLLYFAYGILRLAFG